MMLIILLLLVGTLLVFLETVLIGGIWCVAGLACYGWAIWTAYVDYSAACALAVAAVSLAACAGAFAVWLYVLPKTALGKKLYLNSKQDGKAPVEDFARFVSRRGVALTPLIPSGKIEVDGRVIDAHCDSAHIEKGTAVEIISADAFSAKVRKI